MDDVCCRIIWRSGNYIFQPPSNGPRYAKEVQGAARGEVEGGGGEAEVSLPHEPRHARNLQPKAPGKSAQRQSVNGDPQKCRRHLTLRSPCLKCTTTSSNFESE